MIKNLLIRVIDFFTEKLASMAWHETNKYRLIGGPNYSSPGMFMTDDQYKEHIKTLPPKLAVITGLFFNLKKIKREITNE